MRNALIVLLVSLVSTSTTAQPPGPRIQKPAATPIPPALVQAAMERYPHWLSCMIAKGDPDANADVPLGEEEARGWLYAVIDRLEPGGHSFAVVSYLRVLGNSFQRIFVQDGEGWDPAPVAGYEDCEIRHFEFDTSVKPDEDVLFRDVDGDGVKEISLYAKMMNPNNRTGYVPEAVMVLKLSNGSLQPMTEINTGRATGMDGPPACQYDQMTIGPRGTFSSDTGVGFLDVDSDGVDELLVYPDLGGARPPEDPRSNNVYDVPTTGTRVFKMLDGKYALQYETPIGTAGMPPVGAATKPASVPTAELEATAKPGGKDSALTLYLMPPQGCTMDDVDWPTLRVADLHVAATADKGVMAAPHTTSDTQWTRMRFAGQRLLLERLMGDDLGRFQQFDKDPLIYPTFSGRLHMTTPFREIRFSKKAVFSWLWQRWQAGAGDSERKVCLTEGNHQRCYTPISLPIRVNLKANHGFAMGEALLWIETKEGA